MSSMQAQLPLSLSQREVWLDQRAWPGSTHLHIGGFAFLHGPLDLPLLRRSLQQLVEENEALRLQVLPDAGAQCLLQTLVAPLDIIPLDPSRDARTAMLDWWRQECHQRFDLAEAPPWRCVLLTDGQDFHGLSIRFHHLVMDGWSTQLFMQRWTERYTQLQQDLTPVPSESGAYLAFISSGQEYLGSPACLRDADYWSGQWPSLQEPALPPRHALRAPDRLPRAHVARLQIPRRELQPLQTALQALEASLFDAALSAIALYLQRSRGVEHLAVGMPSLNRGGARWRQTLGMFVSVQPLLLHLQPQMSIGALLADCRHQARTGLRHARYPLSETAHRLQLMRSGRDSLLDVMVSLERQSYALGFGPCRLEQARQSFADEARYPLALTLCEFGDAEEVELVLELSERCFEADEAELLLRRIWHLMKLLPGGLDSPLDAPALMPDEESWALIHGLHKNLASTEQAQPVWLQFSRQAGLHPEALALVWDDPPDQAQSMSYAELHQRSLALASALQGAGLRQGQVLALLLDRSPALLAALLAAWRCGACVLPLSTELPQERLLELLNIAAPALLLGSRQDVMRWCSEPLPGISLSPQGEVLDVPVAGAGVGAARVLQEAAYLLFTSGSTGRPKAVRVGHDALARRLAWLVRRWQIGPQDRSVQQVQPSFDPALIELLLPLIQGGSVALMPPGRQHPERLAAFMQRHQVSLCALVPSSLAGLLAGLQRHPVPSLRVACCGGEVLAPALSNRFLAETGAALFNVYGPTEACIFASAWPCEPWPETEALPLGPAVDDTRIYVLDERQRPQPFGVSGEVWLAGPTLALGYLDEQDTAAAFLPDPFHPGERMYRSGDRGWLDVQGRLHFAGRRDRQLKLRGYRIDLGDVEAACLKLPGVHQAAVQCVNQGEGQRLHAWLAGPRAQAEPGLAALLRQRLPDYMVPSSLTLLPELPLSASGKLMLDALPPPARAVGVAAEAPVASAMEAELLDLWRVHLKRESIGLAQNFFDLGGDSLAALAILSAMEDRLGRRLPLQLVVDHPTVRQLAFALAAPQAAEGVLLPLSRDMQAPRLYVAASGHGDVLRLQALARALEGRLSVLMLQPPRDAPQQMAALAEVYADAVASDKPRRFWLAGFSVGGVSALACCRALEARGMAPQGLILLDSIHPDAVLGGTSSWRALGWLVRRLHVQDLSMNGRRLGAMFADPGLVAQVMALRHHRCEACACAVWLLKTTGLLRWNRLLFHGWQRLFGERLRSVVVRGLHGSMFEPEHVHQLADSLEALMTARTKP
ncbi:non-ribosomal peptide synthetase [Roseateles sp. DB2]|uniref:non-ribosomal peptide synthetase n=1 Tax=Roseateles sp. DB2 TaxID=3453717 RepID=UPI003EE86537